MVNEQEHNAKALYKNLKKIITPIYPDAEVKIKGKGVHWQCAVTRKERDVTVSCYKGPQYFVTFRHESHTFAMGRTSQIADVSGSVLKWIRRNLASRSIT